MDYVTLIQQHVTRLPDAEQKEVLDFILFLAQRHSVVPPIMDAAEREHRLCEALKHLQTLNPFADITDPVAWQREMRKDRPLPSRED